ncbi:MAG TPA: SDR family oxidoreductase [Acidobacteriaceae bacterium]|nr:SDR family oxidoreductase [Acidobacteriaceae bacterium]
MDGIDFGGRVAVVTGGASGIGKAIANRLAVNGAQVWVLDIDGTAAKAAAEEITQAGGRVRSLPCNIADPQSVSSAFGSIASAGSIDVLANCAGIAHIGTIATTTLEDFDRIFRVNAQGFFLCMQAAIATMLKQSSGGVILNMSSLVAIVGIPERFAYSMSKGAVKAMTLSVAKDYLDKKIRCNCISPARVHTPFVDGYLKKNYPGREKEMLAVLEKTQPIGRMASPDEVAGLAVYLCSDLAGFITGADIPFDGGVLNLHN